MQLTLMALLISAVTVSATAEDARLIDAAKRGDQPAVRALVADGVDVDARHPDGATALLWAAYRGDTTMVDLLLAAEADVNAANEYGETPLSVACQSRALGLAETLLSAGADPSVAKPTGETALMTAVRVGHPGIVNLLLARGADVGARETRKGQTALMWAVAGKHLGITRALIGAGADARAASHSGSTPLHFAVQQVDLETLKLLLAAGADPDATMTYRLIDDNLQSYIEAFERVTPLSLAIEICWRDAPEMAMLGTPQQRPPYFSCTDNAELGKVLLEAGADPDLADDTEISPLHRAVRARMPTLVQALIDHGAPVDARIPPTARRAPPGKETVAGRAVFELPIGGTPFLLAALGPNPNVEIMQILLTAGADPRIPTQDGGTPLMAVAGLVEIRPATGIYSVRARPAAGAVLLEAARFALDGGGVNGVDEAGETTLHGAVRTGSPEFVQFLVGNGAELEAENALGQTPLALAMTMNRRRYPPVADAETDDVGNPVVDLLHRLGARIPGESPISR